jgi:hypothetical protein
MRLITGTVKSTELQWLSAPGHGDLVRDPTVEPPGFDLRRREWVLLYRFRTSQGKCAFLMHRWGYSNATYCDYGHPCQTMDNIRQSSIPCFRRRATVFT